jgi:hypothetical protein
MVELEEKGKRIIELSMNGLEVTEGRKGKLSWGSQYPDRNSKGRPFKYKPRKLRIIRRSGKSDQCSVSISEYPRIYPRDIIQMSVAGEII